MSSSTGPTRSRVSLPFCLISSILSEELNRLEATEHCGPLPEFGGKQNTTKLSPKPRSWHLYRVPVSGPAPRGDRVSLFILCSFVLAGTLWITPEASYCLDALTAHRVVNPRPNPLQTTQPYRIFPARPTHSFHLSHRSGNLCRVSLFLFSVLFLHTIRNDRHGSAPDGPENHALNRRARGNLTTRYLQQNPSFSYFPATISLQKRSGSVEAEFLCLLFCVSSISHLSNCLTPERRKRVTWTGGEGHTRTRKHSHWERERTRVPRWVPPSRRRTLGTQQHKAGDLFFLHYPVRLHITSRVSLFFFVFVFFWHLPPSLWITNDNEEEQDLTAAAGEGNTKQAVNRTNIHKTRRIFYYSWAQAIYGTNV